MQEDEDHKNLVELWIQYLSKLIAKEKPEVVPGRNVVAAALEQVGYVWPQAAALPQLVNDFKATRLRAADAAGIHEYIADRAKALTKDQIAVFQGKVQ